ncbi:MAG: bifunctional 2-keto-4-hydroxyglutarate aldolase/2-keto-3-deoxy-6-phosphogluconate aldolase [Firmicutes bacterium]|uniref:Bifunctional 2-keto-4-hydroxyglutarate aldolase/2-keto-3-deoxy-6-phosphogluconate aldolase n=1 Tax=Candidatus Scatoplasma merdavium TaxID=2840932 RepID=A0A9D9D8Y7_9BACL|nr:bifunctional 2-keto-4-hydroxyglutarate aldolase/2-keto-3-deoxy-6-phosphogluconate aldolase [Candidatus Scatoplasma merdavium]
MKGDIVRDLLKCGVVAVIRANSVEEAKKLADCCVKGGIVGLEITFTVPGADEVIAQLAADNDAKYIVGAGTVLDATTARLAIMKGAKFIVAPNFDQEVAELCNLYQIPYMPGCYTITEITRAMKAGADVIKIFPGSQASPSYFKAVHGPLPQANLMPTGGVDIGNVKDWIQAGAVAVGTGSSLTAPAKKGDYEGVVKNARAFVEAVAEAKKGL